jgi:hypothetical protein
MNENHLAAIDHEIDFLTKQRQFYAEQLEKSQRLAAELDVWTQRLADALFLTLVDSGAHGAECSGILRDWREWVIEWEANQ